MASGNRKKRQQTVQQVTPVVNMAGTVQQVAPVVNMPGMLEDSETEIDLVDLFYYLWGHVKYIIGGFLLGGVIAALLVFLVMTPTYESTAKLYVLNSSDSVVNLSDLQIGSYLAADYQEVFKTWEVNEQVISSLNLPYTYEELEKLLTVSNPSGTRILYITIRSKDAMEATAIANEYADVVRKYVADTMATDAPNILSTALEPIEPVSPKKTQGLILGMLAGALLAIAILVVRFVMDDKIHTADDILKHTGIPTIAVVPMMARGKEKELKDGGSVV